MDELAYVYDSGNKLVKVTDAIIGTAGDGGFKDGINTGIDYTYDENGNMLTDANKGIINISYNYLNLPSQVTFATDRYIDYIYDATGMKLQKIVTDTGNSTKTNYAGNYIYEDNGTTEELKFFNQPEGYVEPDGNGGFEYIYQYKDHLGNVRLSYSDADGNGSINAATEIVEENNYYPFGLKHKGYNNVQNGRDHKYGFGNKEEQDELGMGWIDITARNYDPALGRWMNIDPLADQMRRHSPYNYAFNNPMFFIDPDGMNPFGFDYDIEYNANGKPKTPLAPWQQKPDFDFSDGPRYIGTIAETSNSSGGQGDPPYKGPTAVGVVNQLDEVVVTGTNYNSSGSDLDFAERINNAFDATGNGLSYRAEMTRVGSNGKIYFETPKGGIFYGNKTVSSTFSLMKGGGQLARFTGPAGYAISAGQIGYGVYQDRGQFGYQAQVATAGAVGGAIGSWAGAKVGATTGATLGGAIGVWFFGVGAAPGAAVGGVIGGIVGAVGGGYYGGQLGQSFIKP